MKATQWQKYLEEQGRLHAKRVFTVTELANASGTSLHALNVELGRLIQRGVMERYARGIYGLPGAATPETLLPYLDPAAYMTGHYALHARQFLTQVPTRFTCFTNRRHNRSRERITSVGRYVFVCVAPPLYAPPRQAVVAAPEQALCDFVYLMRRSGVNPETVVTFRNLDKPSEARLTRVARRYPATVRRQVSNILQRKG